MYGNLTQLTMPYVISVRQTGSLPPASFRFLVAEDTLALSYVLGTINPHQGLSPIRLRPCRAHHKKATTLPEKVMAFYLSSHFRPSRLEVSLDMELWTHRALSVIVMQVQ